jgi:hypothetical protein
VDIEVALARMETQLTGIAKSIDEVKLSSTEALSKSRDALQASTSAEQKANTLFTRIDEAREERNSLIGFQEQAKGFLKAIAFGVGVIQAIFVAFLIWLVSSVAGLREQKGVLDYRLQQVELRNAKN